MPSECHSESNVAVSTASRLRHLLRQVSLQLLDFPVTTALALVTSVQLHSQKSDGVQSTLRECGVLPCPPGPANFFFLLLRVLMLTSGPLSQALGTTRWPWPPYNPLTRVAGILLATINPSAWLHCCVASRHP
jgi:hypothetical protein